MEPTDDQTDLAGLVDHLVRSDIEFVLVGGLAAVAQGATFATFDVDIVHRRTIENVDRLVELLLALGARHRRPSAPLPPSRAALLGPGHSLFQTRLGPLDALGAIESGKTYEDLLPDAVTIEVNGRSLRVLSLEALIQLKEGSTEPKDKLRMPILKAILGRRSE